MGHVVRRGRQTRPNQKKLCEIRNSRVLLWGANDLAFCATIEASEEMMLGPYRLWYGTAEWLEYLGLKLEVLANLHDPIYADKWVSWSPRLLWS
jgi:hypothetical protein